MGRRSPLLVLIGLALGVSSILWFGVGRAGEPDDPRPREAEGSVSLRPEGNSLSAPEITDRRPVDDEQDEEDSVREPSDEELAHAADLLVTVSDGRAPIDPVRLTVHGTLNGEPATERTDARTGQALFRELEPGPQLVHVTELPPGWILSTPRRPDGRADGRDAIEIDLSPGANVCEIRVERVARVFGRVLGPEGEPLYRAMVQLTRFDGGEELGRKPTLWFLVEGGSYEGCLHEGVWSAQVIGLGPAEAGPLRDPSLRDLVLPLPQVCRLHAGSTTQMDFVCDRFSGVIEGRILDEANRPFGGLQLNASRITTMTEPESGRAVTIVEEAGRDLSTTDGSFTFANLGRGSYRIQVDTKYFFAVGPPGINGIGAPVDPVDVTFGAEPKLRVQIAARPSHQLRVRGSIVVNRGALAPAETTPSIFLSARAGGLRRDTVRSWIDGANRQFDFYVESAVQDPCLEVTIGGERAVYPLTLDPEVESTQLVLRFPR